MVGFVGLGLGVDGGARDSRRSESWEQTELEEGLTNDQSDPLFDDDDDASGSEHLDEDVEKDVVYKPDPPDEGIYGMAVASLVVDTRSFLRAQGTNSKLRHVARLALTMFLTFGTLGLQAYIVLMTKFIVTPNEVEKIRQAYSDFEYHMYRGHTTVTEFGYYRGIDGFYDLSQFENITAKWTQADQTDICGVSLSQPLFLAAILLVWTVTCIQYMRRICNLMRRILSTRTVPSMASKNVLQACGDGTELVVGLTCGVKLCMTIIQIMAIALNLLLLWVGSRWLVATLGFGEILLNAIALEFILYLHELLYHAVVPYSMKMNLGGILIPYPHRSEKPSWGNMFGAFALLLVAVGFVMLYILAFEQVLPGYKWDVMEACHAHDVQVAATRRRRPNLL